MHRLSGFVFLSIVHLLASPLKAGLAEPEPEQLHFKCRLLINPADGKTIPDAIIKVAGGTIIDVGSAADIPIPPGARLTDFGDKYIIPGLVDTHGHLYTRLVGDWRKTNALLPGFFLAAGVTAVGNPGSIDFAGDVALREKIDSGQLSGPRFFLAGEYVQMPPKYVREDLARVRKKNQEFIRRAYEAGCLLSTGTDFTLLTMLPGWTLWREMEIFAEAGLPPMAVLKAATSNGAYALGRTDQLGSVEPGKMADFVVLDANPLEAIGYVRRVHRVVKGGVIYDREALLEPLVGKID